MNIRWHNITDKSYRSILHKFDKGSDGIIDLADAIDKDIPINITVTAQVTRGKKYVRVGVYSINFPELTFEDYMLIPFDDKFPKTDKEILYSLELCIVNLHKAKTQLTKEKK